MIQVWCGETIIGILKVSPLPGSLSVVVASEINTDHFYDFSGFPGKIPTRSYSKNFSKEYRVARRRFALNKSDLAFLKGERELSRILRDSFVPSSTQPIERSETLLYEWDCVYVSTEESEDLFDSPLFEPIASKEPDELLKCFMKRPYALVSSPSILKMPDA